MFNFFHHEYIMKLDEEFSLEKWDQILTLSPIKIWQHVSLMEKQYSVWNFLWDKKLCPKSIYFTLF